MWWVPNICMKLRRCSTFQPVTFDGDASKLLTVFLAFVPASSASDLQAMVSAPTSQFYQQSGIQSQIAAAVVPTFSIFSYSSTAAAPQGVTR